MYSNSRLRDTFVCVIQLKNHVGKARFAPTTWNIVHTVCSVSSSRTIFSIYLLSLSAVVTTLVNKYVIYRRCAYRCITTIGEQNIIYLRGYSSRALLLLPLFVNIVRHRIEGCAIRLYYIIHNSDISGITGNKSLSTVFCSLYISFFGF